MLVNHLGLTLTKEDLQDLVDLMEPYGQISNGIEMFSPPLDVSCCTDYILAPFNTMIPKAFQFLMFAASKYIHIQKIMQHK